MRSITFRALVTGFHVCSIYHIYHTDARATDWGCEVLLCIANPGGPTEFSQCRPPIAKLWKELAKGRSFPTCRGVGFKTSRPGYEPYYCDAGYRLEYRQGSRAREAVCISLTQRNEGGRTCSSLGWKGEGPRQWFGNNENRTCKSVVAKQPHLREKPRFVDVIIEGAGRQRVWF